MDSRQIHTFLLKTSGVWPRVGEANVDGGGGGSKEEIRTPACRLTRPASQRAMVRTNTKHDGIMNRSSAKPSCLLTCLPAPTGRGQGNRRKKRFLVPTTLAPLLLRKESCDSIRLYSERRRGRWFQEHLALTVARVVLAGSIQTRSS